MDVLEVDAKEYRAALRETIVYNTAEFNELNSYKVDRVRYFIFADTRKRFALCVGQRADKFLAPFSAPFASFSPLRKHWTVLQLEESVKCLDDLAAREGIHSIKLTPPPSLYNESLVAALQNILSRQGYELLSCELNFALNLKTFRLEDYPSYLSLNGRNMLNAAMRENFSIKHCKDIAEKKIAYEVVVQNHESRGYPVRMTWEQVKETTEIVPHDFFIVLNGDLPVAAAMLFHVTTDIVQLIYWGNIPDKLSAKSMNYLAYKLTAHYHERGMKYLDIGPSTENGVPNYGLCDFKQHIGCEIGSKLVMQKIF